MLPQLPMAEGGGGAAAAAAMGVAESEMIWEMLGVYFSHSKFHSWGADGSQSDFSPLSLSLSLSLSLPPPT